MAQPDPFMTRAYVNSPDGGVGGPMGPIDEQTPLQPGSRDDMKSDDSKGIVMPVALLLSAIAVVSGFALAFSFNETGYRDGSEEGHLDGVHKNSGCQNLFYWLLLQFCLDLIITCVLCLVLMPNAAVDTVGFLGCLASFRLLATTAGFHILYSIGLKREFCNQFLVTWSTMITWLGIFVMLVVGCYLFLILVGIAGPGRKRKQAMLDRPV
jgi:hypothetical protein